MKLQFDGHQTFQLNAVNAIVDLFDGQPLNKGDFEVALQSSGQGLFGSQVQTELGVGNAVTLDQDAILKNLQRVQERNGLDPDGSLEHDNAPSPLNFSIEMETGTGKTYCYLRTIFELNRKYAFKKFIIVVPTVAIREGVLKNLEITAEHFKAIYNNAEYEYFVYDAKRINRLRQFAVSNQIQILVINIDAFRKNFTGTDEEQKSNVIYKEADRLSGRQPIEFIQATNPILIIDEPQSVDNTDKAREAIRALRPLCTLRYSATHRNPYNLVYRLDPIKAFELRLVKQIVVSSVVGTEAQNDGYVKLLSVSRQNGIKAKVEIDVQSEGLFNAPPKRKRVTVKHETDIFSVSNEREHYRNGFQITEINSEPGHEFIEFNNHRRLVIGQEIGGIRDDIWRVQIKTTIRRHLEKIISLRGKGIKVLSLFFIDRVANYRSFDEEGKPTMGKYAQFFEESMKELLEIPTYKDVLPFSIERLHDGYFAQGKKGAWKDTSGETQADDDIYNLIMKDKERLLSLDEPLQFIFTHSALREGWDNPNVFQICTLNETTSTIKKRQEIGRGLRLPVNQNGERVFDDNINRLLIVANESYDSFAKSLQKDYEDDCGVTFGKIPLSAFAQLPNLKDGETVPLGRDSAQRVFTSLIDKGYLTKDGQILPKFNPKALDFDMGLEPDLADLKWDIVDLVQSYKLDRHIKEDKPQKPAGLKKQVLLEPEFQELWSRINAKTTYAVEFETELLVKNAVRGIKLMEKIAPIRIHVSDANVKVARGGVTTLLSRKSTVGVEFKGAIPDLISYIQAETELTRSTIVRILTASNRLTEFFVNPQKFMDAVAGIMNRELHKLIIDGIKYERIVGQEYRVELFKDEELFDYLSLLPVKNSVYENIPFDSEIEREFAEALDNRTDIKLFVKLPRWFKVETPLGTYNPDWAIIKHEDTTVYLVRETKGTKNFEHLRISEAEKIRCGRRHFESLGTGVSFDVVVRASDIA